MNKKNLYNTLVVGSWLSSLSFIQSYLKKNKKIDVISFNNLKKNFKNPVNKHIYKILPPQMIGHEYKVNDYFFLNKILVNKNCKFFGSLEFGGLSNYWGLQIDKNIKKDIAHLKKNTQKKILKSFEEIFVENNLLGKIDNKKKNIKYDKIKEKNDKLSPMNLLKKINKKKIIFHNYFVEKIEKHKSGILLKCSDGKKNKIFMTKKLVLGCGTLITTKLIMDYLNIKNEVRINHHPRLFSLYISKRKWRGNMKFQPSHFHVKSKKNPNLFTADFRPGNKIIVDAIIKFKKILKPLKFMINLFREHLIFSNIFLEPKYGNLFIKKRDKSYEIFSKKKDIRKIFRLTSSSVYQFLVKAKKIFPIFHNYFPGFGADFHYFGTIPMRGKGKLSVTENCQLKKNKNIYIIDGSVLNFTKNKYPLGLILANSRRVGKEI